MRKPPEITVRHADGSEITIALFQAEDGSCAMILRKGDTSVQINEYDMAIVHAALDAASVGDEEEEGDHDLPN